MSNALNNVWGWSLRHSPLLAMWRSCRGVFQPNRDAFRLLEQASLPNPVDGVIRTTISRTKLWRDEREQIARELIAHAHDALDEGQDPQRVADTFGDPRRVARLLRRSMKRKRPLSWQAYRYSRRAIGVCFLLIAAGYVLLAVRFYRGQPSIQTDYFAVLGDAESAYTPDQRSWPIIAELGHKWDRAIYELAKDTDTLNSFPRVSATDDGYQDLVLAVRAMEPDLQRLRAAATLPVIGAPKGYELEQKHEEGISWTVGIVPAGPDTYQDQMLIGGLLPQLSWARRLSNLLVFDARLALREGDIDRAVEDIIAVSDLARQCSHEPYMIASLVTIAINEMFAQEVAEAVGADPKVFDEEQLVRLAHAHARSVKADLNLATERMMFDDLLQRVYTDDGNGNGRMTPEGAALLLDLGSITWREANRTNDEYMLIETAAMPAMLLLMNDRAREKAVYDNALSSAELVMRQGPRWIGVLELEEHLLEWRASQRLPLLSPAEMVTPAMQSAVQRFFQHKMKAQAAVAMFAIEVYRSEHDGLPSSLDQIPAFMLPRIPQDLFAPGDSLRYALGEHGGYVLYSVGSDGDDDLGRSADGGVQQVSDLGLRFPVFINADADGKPIMELESSGKPKLADPQGPDGDWILIDTRPSPDDAGES